jgi:hypothetical protein
VDLATSAQRPDELGRVLGEAGLEAEEHEVLTLLAAAEESHRQLARGYVAGRFAAKGWDWAEVALERGAPDWGPEAYAGFLIALPRASRIWDWAERLGEETERAYWRQFGAWGLAEPADVTRAVRKLLAHGRPYGAVDLLGIYVDQRPDPELVADALERAAGTPLDRDVHPTMLTYHVAQLLNYVEATDAVDLPRLARLEWAYLPLLRYGDRPAKLLHRELTRDPEFFVEVVSWVYKAENEDPREASEEQRVRAQLGDELLDSWHEVPGRRPDDSVDVEILSRWVRRARELLADRGRTVIGDRQIGRMLRYGPPEADGAWPDAAIRHVIEDVASAELETGLEAEIFNSRGVTTRGPLEGGRQEHEHAERYAGYAVAIGGRWPRTAALLGRIAGVFEADARLEDAEAELREDLGR